MKAILLRLGTFSTFVHAGAGALPAQESPANNPAEQAVAAAPAVSPASPYVALTIGHQHVYSPGGSAELPNALRRN
jgi:hypothetical protein